MRRSDLISDCGNCAAICCVVSSFDASEDFAFGKAAGVRCRHLLRDFRCAIHDQLAERGFAGCAIYDCYGAGPRITREFAKATQHERHEAFLVLRVVHEWLWLLTEAAKLCPAFAPGLRDELAHELQFLDATAAVPVSALRDIDLAAQRRSVLALLRRVGAALGGRPGAKRRLAVVE